MSGTMRFADRSEAGVRLADLLVGSVSGPAVVLGVPRGGVVVAAPVAAALRAPLDIVVPKKVSAPGNPELGLGAVAPGVQVLDERLVRRLDVGPEYLAQEVRREQAEVERRTRAYRGARPPVDLAGKTAVIVDDGVATGGTAFASIAWARKAGARQVIFAAPVAPPETVARLQRAADDVIVLHVPSGFSAVGEWYEDFEQIGDEEVRRALAPER